MVTTRDVWIIPSFWIWLMCCMLSTFHMWSQIVANIRETSILFSQYMYLFRPCWRKTLPENYYPYLSWWMWFHEKWIYDEFEFMMGVRRISCINSLAPEICGSNFKSIIFILIIQGTHCEIAARRMPQNLTDEKSTLVQVMAWCCQATSHYLNQCWPRSVSPYGITRPPGSGCDCRINLSSVELQDG